jgi:hypothetical protein
VEGSESRGEVPTKKGVSGDDESTSTLFVSLKSRKGVEVGDPGSELSCSMKGKEVKRSYGVSDEDKMRREQRRGREVEPLGSTGVGCSRRETRAAAADEVAVVDRCRGGERERGREVDVELATLEAVAVGL